MRLCLRALFLVGVLDAFVAPCPLGAEQEPEELLQLRLGYLTEVESVSRPIRERLLARLDSLKRALGGRGDARGAAAVQDEIDRVTANALDPATIAKFAGVWRIDYQPTGSRRYAIRADGRVREEEHNGTAVNPPRETRIVMRGEDVLVDFGDGAIERLSIKGGRLISEIFALGTLYPKGTVHVNGIGRLVPPGE